MESFFILRNISKPEKIIAENNGFNKYAFILGPVWGIFKGYGLKVWFGLFIQFCYLHYATNVFFVHFDVINFLGVFRERYLYSKIA